MSRTPPGEPGAAGPAPQDAPLPAELARVHLVGIGGAGMSGIARILLARGGQVSGSDARDSRALTALRASGAQIRVGHDPAALDLLPGGPTVVVTTTSAIPDTNPELVAARERGIAVTVRPAVLATLMSGHRSALVAGTHGKTSTTSMLVVVAQRAGMDPSFAIGGQLNDSGANAHHGSGSVFVAEADESDGSLLAYQPDVAVVTNVDVDHLDHFGTLEAYVAVFDRFCEQIAPGGLLVACDDDPGARALADRAADNGTRVARYGHREGVAARIAARESSGAVRVVLAGEAEPRLLSLGVPGDHMVLNALGALLAARELGADTDVVLTALAGFGGVHRRFQEVGRAAGVLVVDDYAHHPTEVRAVLAAARGVAGEGHRVVVLFQPHLYSRTATFAAEFGAALSLADEVVVLDVYAAREQPMPGVTGALVAQSVTVPVRFLPSLRDAPGVVASLARAGDVVITMGAGDVTMLAPGILAELAGRAGGPGAADGPGAA